MKDQKTAIQTTEQVTQNDSEPIKEQTPQQRLIEIAQLVGIEVDEQQESMSDEIVEKLIDKLILKIGEIDDNLRPLAEAMGKDERVRVIINSLCDGKSLEEILVAIGAATDIYENVASEKYENHFDQADKFCSKHKLEHSDIECFADYAKQLFDAVQKGEITLEMLEQFWMSFKFETEIQNAYRAGVLKGRNMQIEQLNEEFEATDGLGNIAAGGAISPSSDDGNYIERLVLQMR